MESDGLYIFDRLKTGDSLNIIFMAHNAYWANVEMLADHYKNCKVQTFGKGTADIEMAKLFSKWYDPVENYDLIVLRGTNFDESEYKRMKKLAHEISKSQNKNVTIGYSYHNPNYEKVDWNIEHVIRLAKISGDEEIEDITTVLNLHPLELINHVLMMHDNLCLSKTRKK